ncbi:hypothetical protein GCM10023194_32590 [Planotetraspora phitsanulokensis]|uniref:Uncharacterized protein n=1 Tax=Planotetraspora phitsanulokensis TaxID=575192 RepID=A0A8J3XC00_9ACTN|nr:hypothetical protein Pph01_06050 [Planotetraspora phitsanulokensis]
MTVATPAMAWLGFGPLRPAAANASGTTTAMPTPSSAKPAIATSGCGAAITSRPPTAAITPLARTVRTDPNRSTRASPAILATAMVSVNPVVVAAATPAEAVRTSRRYTADQSRLAPSPNVAQNATAPMSSADLGGSVNRGGGSSSWSGRRSSTYRQAARPIAMRVTAATAWWIWALTSRCAASVPTAEPINAPTLHMPCSPDMIDLSSRLSTSTPSAFITTSHIPADAPKTNNARHNVSRPGASDGGIRASVHMMSRPRCAARVPKR